jgi:hypothetical protein
VAELAMAAATSMGLLAIGLAMRDRLWWAARDRL